MLKQSAKDHFIILIILLINPNHHLVYLFVDIKNNVFLYFSTDNCLPHIPYFYLFYYIFDRLPVFEGRWIFHWCVQ